MLACSEALLSVPAVMSVLFRAVEDVAMAAVARSLIEVILDEHSL